MQYLLVIAFILLLGGVVLAVLIKGLRKILGRFRRKK
jgi:hypothetical protein